VLVSSTHHESSDHIRKEVGEPTQVTSILYHMLSDDTWFVVMEGLCKLHKFNVDARLKMLPQQQLIIRQPTEFKYLS
jgi:hypothetical protein